MKRYFVPIITASVLTICTVITRQASQAQSTSPKSSVKTDATIAGVSGARTNNQESPAIFVTEMPAGYRDWKFITVARVGGPFNDLRAKLGNDIAIKAYREGKLPFPDGTIIARIAYQAVSSEENDKAFRLGSERGILPQFSPEQMAKLQAESFVAGSPKNVQFMVKDSKKYASTGGWGFGQFTNGKPDSEAVNKMCFSCHEPAKDRDFVFTRYSP